MSLSEVKNSTAKSIFEISEDCGILSAEDRSTIQQCSYWFEGVLLIIILVFIVFTVLDYCLGRVFAWPWPHESEVWLYIIPRVAYPINNISFCSSIFITVIIAWERYLAVCHPNHYRTNNLTRSTSVRMASYIVPLLIFSVGLNFTKFLETEYYYTYDDPQANMTDALVVEVDNLTHNISGPSINQFVESSLPDILMGNQTEAWSQETTANMEDDIWSERNVTNITSVTREPRLSVRLSKLRNDPDYIMYYSFIIRLLITGIVPVVSLIVFNTLIYQGIKKTRQRARQQRVPRDEAPHLARRRTQLSSELNLAVILVAIVIVFLVCNMPRLLLNMFEFIYLSNILRCGDNVVLPVWFQCFTGFNHLLLIFNASTNFLIYCSCSGEFKFAVKKMVKNLALRLRISRQDLQSSMEVELRAMYRCQAVVTNGEVGENVRRHSHRHHRCSSGRRLTIHNAVRPVHSGIGINNNVTDEDVTATLTSNNSNQPLTSQNQANGHRLQADKMVFGSPCLLLVNGSTNFECCCDVLQQQRGNLGQPCQCCPSTSDSSQFSSSMVMERSVSSNFPGATAATITPRLVVNGHCEPEKVATTGQPVAAGEQPASLTMSNSLTDKLTMTASLSTFSIFSSLKAVTANSRVRSSSLVTHLKDLAKDDDDDTEVSLLLPVSPVKREVGGRRSLPAVHHRTLIDLDVLGDEDEDVFHPTVVVTSSTDGHQSAGIVTDDPEGMVLLLLEGGKIHGRGEWV